MSQRLKKMLLPMLLLLVLLTGCQNGAVVIMPPTEESAEMITEAPTQTVDHSMDITWAKAFRDDKLPEGYVTPDTVAFYEAHEDGEPDIINVPLDEVLEYVQNMGNLPRSHYYEQFIDEKLQVVMQIVDYAMDKGYSRFSMPSTEIIDYDITQASKYINATFQMNNRTISSRTVAKLSMDDGQTLNYTLVVLPGMELYDIDKYHAAMDAARKIVADMPTGRNEAKTALYLYHYLTENVYYNYNDYYSNTDWNLAYDALINHSTVCAGYTEALYYLYNLAGIECITVSGYITAAEGEAMGGYHIWNIAKVDGEYYYFDATWDAGSDIEDYQFFGISEQQLQDYYPRVIDTFDTQVAPTCDKTLSTVS